MSSHITITFGDIEYRVPKMNVGQIREITRFKSDAFGVLEVALRRAEPKIENLDDLEVGADEIQHNADRILQFCGFTRKDLEKKV
jgi:hypothetical protein